MKIDNTAKNNNNIYDKEPYFIIKFGVKTKFSEKFKDEGMREMNTIIERMCGLETHSKLLKIKMILNPIQNS